MEDEADVVARTQMTKRIMLLRLATAARRSADLLYVSPEGARLLSNAELDALAAVNAQLQAVANMLDRRPAQGR